MPASAPSGLQTLRKRALDRLSPDMRSRLRRRWIGGIATVRSIGIDTAMRAPVARAAFAPHRIPTNRPPTEHELRPHLHLGCGDHVLDGFVNIDFLPEHPGVLEWDLLAPWPEELSGRMNGVFSEDLVEHFFFDEQVYLLSQINRVLVDGAVARVLMPDLAKLLALQTSWEPDEDYLSVQFGVETSADAINLGLRFGGHRWLHDAESLARLAERCGFLAQPTPCAVSAVDAFSGMNVRDESTSLSMAADLHKERSLRRWVLDVAEVRNARRVSRGPTGEPIYQALSDDPQVTFLLPTDIKSSQIVSVAVRGSNLTQGREHNHAELYLADSPDAAVPIDTSMQSSHHSWFASYPIIAARVGDIPVSSIRMDPGKVAGDLFVVAGAEVFLY